MIIAFRLLLLVLAAGGVVAGAAIGLGGGGGESAAAFACPMHPEARASAPGECPICRMALEPIGRAAAAGGMSHGDMPGMPDITAVENIRKHRIIGVLRRRSLPASLRELRGPAWVGTDGRLEVVFYNDQIASLAADERGTFFVGRSPKTTFAVRRTADLPFAIPWDRSTSHVYFRLDSRAAPGGAPRLAPGQVGWIEVERKVRDVLTVPASAILQSPEGPYVLAWAGGGKFDKRPIEIGETFLKQGFAVVLSGLQLHERVVARAAFFVDADRRLGVGRTEVLKEDPKDDPKTDMQAAP